jgi:hypothetical protein
VVVEGRGRVNFAGPPFADFLLAPPVPNASGLGFPLLSPAKYGAHAYTHTHVLSILLFGTPSRVTEVMKHKSLCREINFDSP